jgi:hypothetical protein
VNRGHGKRLKDAARVPADALTGVASDREGNRDLVNRTTFLDTPRRYEQPVEEDGDPVMPASDPTLNTKI